MLPQRPETVITYLACFQMAAIAVPLSFLFGPDALEYRLNDSGAKIAIVDPDTLPKLKAIWESVPGVEWAIGVAGARAGGVVDWDETLAGAPREFDPVATRASDPAAIIYTSGTTGPPKGALLPQSALLGNCPASSSRMTASRKRGPLLVACRLGVDGAGSGTRSCRRSITGRRSSGTAGASMRSSRSGFSRNTPCATRFCFRRRSR
jgi:acyl-coenzyme A synthetase/AMP-(fatty) acid ligase